MSRRAFEIRLSNRSEADRVYATVRHLRPIFKDAIRKAWFEFARDLKSEADEAILDKGSKTGRIYFIRIRGGRVRRHQASAPGETHANRTGKLRRSLSWKVTGTSRLDFGYGVSTTGRNASPRYAPFVEYGTRFMEPRPSLANAIRTVGDRRIEQGFETAMERELREFRPT